MQPYRRRSDRLLAAVCALAAGLGGALVRGAVPASADTPRVSGGGVLIGQATASPIRASYEVPNFLIVSQLVDAAGPIAQSTLDPFGNVASFASLPYPGEAVVNGPGIAAVVFGKAVPFTVPGYVRADYPANQEASAQDASGQYSLQALAHEKTASGDARLVFGTVKAQPTGASATTSIVLGDDGGMKVIADSVAKGLDFGDGLLRIAQVRTHSVTSFSPGSAKPVTEATTAIEGATVANRPVSLGPDGVSLLGQPTGVPVKDINAELNQRLADAGISIRLTPALDLNGGRQTEALEVRLTQPLPVGSRPVGTLRVSLGQTLTAIVGSGQPATEVGTVASPEHVGTASAESTALDVGPGGPAPAIPSAPVGAPSSVPVPDLPFSAPTLGLSSAPPPPNTASPPDPRAGPGSVRLSPSTPHRQTVRLASMADPARSLYLVVLAGAVAALAGAALLVRKAVRAT